MIVVVPGRTSRHGSWIRKTLKRRTGILVRMKTWCILTGLALICAMLIAGCVGPRPPGGSSGSDTQTIVAQVSVTPTLPAGSPAVLIVDPPFDGGVSSGIVTVSVQVTGFALVPPGGPNRPGAGHLVFYRDVTPKTAPGETALTPPGTCNTSSVTSYT